MNQLREIGEFGFIHRIRQYCQFHTGNLVKGIGDDAAVIHPVADGYLLITTDLLAEGIHFLRDAISGYSLGQKAVAVNLSDIAAMGGDPGEIVVSLAVPPDCPLDYLDDLYRGMVAMARDHGAAIVGGDTTGSRSDLIINVTVTGHARSGRVLYRHTARPGDHIFVTDYLGHSRAGLHMLLKPFAHARERFQPLLDAHLMPKPCIAQGKFFAASGAVTSAMDLSDGLTSDLSHILAQSQVGARIYQDRIPISAILADFCTLIGEDPVSFALNGGEDYALLFTVDPGHVHQFQDAYATTFDKPIFPIGEITDSRQLQLIYPDGQVMPLAPSGWDHFQSSEGDR